MTTVILILSSLISTSLGIKYFVGYGLLSWPDAKKYCESQGGKLASIHSAEDFSAAKAKCQYVISKKPVDATKSWGGCWIGLTDQNSIGTYYWDDGTKIDYGFNNNDPTSPTKGVSPWWVSEPNGANSAAKWIHLWTGGEYKYADLIAANGRTMMYPLCNGVNDYELIARHPYGLWFAYGRYPSGCFDSIYGDYFFFHLGSCNGHNYQSLLDPVDEKYHFKIIWNTIKKFDGSKWIDNYEKIELEWSQTSWIQSDTIVGFEPENEFPAIEAGAPWNGAPFSGLGLSDYWGCYLASDASGYNCVGLGTSQGAGFICYGGQVCGSMELYVRKRDYCSIADCSCSESISPGPGFDFIKFNYNNFLLLSVILNVMLIVGVCGLYRKANKNQKNVSYEKVINHSESESENPLKM